MGSEVFGQPAGKRFVVGRISAGDQCRHDHLTPFLVRTTSDQSIGDGRVFTQYGFNLIRSDFLTAADDDLIASAKDFQTISVQSADIASDQPLVFITGS